MFDKHKDKQQSWRIEFPSEGREILRFKNRYKKIKVPVTMVAESIIVYDNHIPSGVCILLEIVDGTKILREHTGTDYVDKFIDFLK